MIVHYSIKRYGTWEYQTVDIDMEKVIKKALKSTVESCGGYNKDALNTIGIDYLETARDLLEEV